MHEKDHKAMKKTLKIKAYLPIQKKNKYRKKDIFVIEKKKPKKKSRY